MKNDQDECWQILAQNIAGIDHTSIPNHQRNSSKNAPGIMKSMFLVQQNVRSPKLGWFETFSRPPALMVFFFTKTAHLKFPKYLLRISGTIASFKVKYTNIYFLRVDTSMSWGLIEKPGLFLRHTPQFCEMAKANLQDG